MAKVRLGMWDGIGVGATLLFILVRLFLPPPAPTPTAACGFTDADLQPDPTAEVVLSVWAHATTNTCWRAFVPLLAARRITEPTIGIDLHPINFSERNDYNRTLQLAAASTHPPAIASMHSWYVDDFVRRGLLRPVDDCLTQYDEFKEIIPMLFPIFAMNGHIWAIPTQIDLQLFFFNKSMLRTLGWPDEQIDQLPMQIAEGTFTLDDLVATARHAIAAGVVEPEFAYWPIYTKLRHMWPVYKAYGGRRMNAQGQMVIDKRALQQTYAFHSFLFNEGWHMPRAAGNDSLGTWPTGALWRETVANGRVLFWTGVMSQWTNWRQQAEITNETEWLEKTVGVALYPGAKGRRGQIFIDSLNAMVIFQSGVTTQQESQAACRLLAEMLTPQLNHHLIQQENVLSALDPRKHEELLQDLPYQQAVSYMIDYIDWVDFNITNVDHFNDVIRDELLDVELGQIRATEAADQAVAKLESELGDNFVVRP